MKIKKSYLLEVALSKSNTISFPTDSFLDGKNIIAIEAFGASQVTLSPLGKTVASNDILNQGYIGFNIGGERSIDNLPLSTLVTSNNNGVVKEVENLKLQIVKSALFFPSTEAITAGQVILINFYYND